MNNYSPNFIKAFKEVIDIEGGHVDHPNDRGGETKYGISKRVYPDEDIENLPLSRAMFLYWRDYWDNYRLNIEKLEDYSIQLEVFDTSINMGQVTAAKIFQEALNLMNRGAENIEEDGWIGDNTIQQYKKANKKILLKVLNGLQFCRYRDIVKNNPTQKVFFNGWMKRV